MSLILIILIVLLIAGAVGPHAYRGYSGPGLDWLWVIAIILILWLLFGGRVAASV